MVKNKTDLSTELSVEMLEPLIVELTKEKPNASKVKSLMLSTGLDYTTDPIQQMSCVLTAMSDISGQIKRRKRSEMVDL